MQKTPCFIILSPGFAANEEDSTVLPFAQSFVLSFRKLYPEIKLFIIGFQYPHKAKKYTWNGAEVIALGGADKSGLSRKMTWLKAILTTYKIRRQYQVIGLFSFGLAECALVGQYASRLYKAKQFSWIIGQDAKPTNKILKWLKISKETIVSMSPNLVKQLNKFYVAPDIKVIPSGINQGYFDAISAIEDRYDILGVGSLIQLKNYELFIHLVACLKQFHPNIKSAIIGGGPERNKLQQLIEEKGLQTNVELKGLFKHEEVVAYMKSSNIFLHTSSYEGQAAVFVEALYCGMDIVCFDVGRLHSNENMFVCQNDEEMQNVLQKLLVNNKQEKKSILIKSIDDTVWEIMNLFNTHKRA